MTNAVKQRAWKRTDDEKRLVACEWADPSAIQFELHYAGQPFSTAALEFEDRRLAERIQAALERTFDAGKLESKLARCSHCNHVEYRGISVFVRSASVVYFFVVVTALMITGHEVSLLLKQ